MLAVLPFTLAGGLAGCLLALVYRRMPASWLLDYGETDTSAARSSQASLTFFPGILLLMLSNAAIFSVARQLLGLSGSLAAVLYLAQPLLLIILADFKTKIIPDQFIIALLPGAVLLILLQGDQAHSWWQRLLIHAGTGLGGGLLLFSLVWLASLLLKKEAMGMGDVKLFAACAFICGLDNLLFLFFLSFLLAAFVALPLLLRRLWRPDSQAELAFGPYIALATMLLLLLGDKIHLLWQAYLGLLI